MTQIQHNPCGMCHLHFDLFADLFTLLAYLRFLTSDYASTWFLHWLHFSAPLKYYVGDVPFQVLLLMFRFHVFTSSWPRLPFSCSAKDVLLAPDNMPKKEGTRNGWRIWGHGQRIWGQLRLQSCSCKFNTKEEKWANKCKAALYKDYHNTWPFLFLSSHLQMSRKLLGDYAALLVGLQSPIKWLKKNLWTIFRSILKRRTSCVLWALQKGLHAPTVANMIAKSMSRSNFTKTMRSRHRHQGMWGHFSPAKKNWPKTMWNSESWWPMSKCVKW